MPCGIEGDDVGIAAAIHRRVGVTGKYRPYILLGAYYAVYAFGICRKYVAVDKSAPIFSPEGKIKFKHLLVVLGKRCDLYRYLGNAVKTADDLQSRDFHAVLGMPHQHIRMYGCLARGQSQIDNIGSVADSVVGAVGDTKHLSVFSYGGADVRLPEFDKNVGV